MPVKRATFKNTGSPSVPPKRWNLWGPGDRSPGPSRFLQPWSKGSDHSVLLNSLRELMSCPLSSEICCMYNVCTYIIHTVYLFSGCGMDLLFPLLWNGSPIPIVMEWIHTRSYCCGMDILCIPIVEFPLLWNGSRISIVVELIFCS